MKEKPNSMPYLCTLFQWRLRDSIVTLQPTKHKVLKNVSIKDVATESHMQQVYMNENSLDWPLHSIALALVRSATRQFTYITQVDLPFLSRWVVFPRHFKRNFIIEVFFAGDKGFVGFCCTLIGVLSKDKRWLPLGTGMCVRLYLFIFIVHRKSRKPTFWLRTGILSSTSQSAEELFWHSLNA